MSMRVFGSVLVAALLWQGWVQAAAAASGPPSSMEHCGMQADPAGDHGCCEDEASVGTDCEVFCGLSPALVTEAAVMPPSRSETPRTRTPPYRAGPDYLPLNPPPIP